ncbi:ABC transporter ATP-binding protein [Nitrosovibrio sp. Nv17]|uniref:ABC transporter ATP-binding protein n=1 Tax=Nitrosovibrio sp. Nv17 TaxID=1855339 RepID=UPI000908DCCF|nr:ABC transporter ATP-binding protein [Nitrosovibrio sp. Nv17]SFW17629.1 ABC-2 type transport system ATP-binding protein [Nitrosovibrio sp. Nv17]
MTRTPALLATNLVRDFGACSAVRGVSLVLAQGEVLGLLGPNGAGKTTLMRMLTGNLAPGSGSVEICGIDLRDRPLEAKAHLGYLPDVPPLYPELAVGEYLRFAAGLRRVPAAAIPAALDRVMRKCGLEGTGRRLIGALSQGYRQRLGIAQAILHEPDVIVLDEPTVGLDPAQIRTMRALIRELGTRHGVILSTHLLAEVESVCDRVQIMHRGSMVHQDTLAGLRRRGLSLEALFMQATTGGGDTEDAADEPAALS